MDYLRTTQQIYGSRAFRRLMQRGAIKRRQQGPEQAAEKPLILG
jgi:hypothetical protein